MTRKRLKSTGGFTLVEVMAATVILSIAVIGASGYRYHATLDARKAAMHSEAARAALLLCESWRGVKGSETYNPTTHLGANLTVTAPGEADDVIMYLNYIAEIPQDFTVLGSYKVATNDGLCYPVLSYKDTGTGLRVLNVAVAWPMLGQSTNGGDGYSRYPTPDNYKVFKLTTYISN